MDIIFIIPTSKMVCNSFQSVKNIINTTVYTDLVCIINKYMYTCCKLLSNSLYDLTDHCTVNKMIAAPMQHCNYYIFVYLCIKVWLKAT